MEQQFSNENFDRSEGARPRNGLFHSCACGRVAGVVWLLGSAGRLGFVVVVVAHARRARPLWGGVFRGTFRGKGHTGRCSPKRDLRFGVLRTALGAISNKKQKLMRKNTVLDDYTTHAFCPLLPSVSFFSDSVPERFSCRRFHAVFLILRDGLTTSGVLAREVRQFLLATSRDVF